jgi:Holliday junction resolvase
MPNRNYERGYRFEREIVKQEKDAGALFVTRGAGSHGSDIVSVYAREVYIIEAKTTEEYPPPLYRDEMWKLARLANYILDENVYVEFWVKIMKRGVVRFRMNKYGAWIVAPGTGTWYVDDAEIAEWVSKVCYA